MMTNANPLRDLADCYAQSYTLPPSLVDRYVEVSQEEAWFTIHGSPLIVQARLSYEGGQLSAFVTPTAQAPEEIARQLEEMGTSSRP